MKLLRMPEVKTRVRLGQSTIYERVKEGTFPAPVKQGSSNYWIDIEIDAYLRRLMSERPANPPTPAS